jgi:hypothetical protein
MRMDTRLRLVVVAGLVLGAAAIAGTLFLLAGSSVEWRP